MTKLNQIGQFARGFFISLVLSAVAAGFGFAVVIYLQFAGSGNPFVFVFVLLVPTVPAITYQLVRGSRARLLGAVLYYPAAALLIFAGYQLRWPF